VADSKQPVSRLPSWILLSAVCGLACGLFFGERMAFLQPLGLAYSKMLEIAVFPYIICSLLSGLGGLVADRAWRLLRASWHVYVLLWVTTFITIYLLALAIPSPMVSAVLTSPADTPSVSLLDLLIPANIIEALSRNTIPAVVIFSVLYGIAIQSVPQKAAFLEVVDVLRVASVRIWNWIVYFAPVGVFALFASASGTIKPDAAGTVVAYIGLFLIGTLALGFLILPFALSRIIPRRAGEILHDLQSGFTLALVTTISAAALPFIQQAAEKLTASQGLQGDETNDVIRATSSISYVLSQLGNYFITLFILYLSYQYKVAISSSDAALLPFMALMSGIGSPSASVDAVAFLGTWLHMPSSATDLYVETMTVTRYGQVAVSVMGLAFVTLAVPLIYFGRAKLQLRRLLPPLMIGLAGFAALGLAGRSISHILFPPHTEAALLSRTLDPRSVAGLDAIIHKTRPADLAPLEDAATIDGIRKRKRIRVGYGTRIVPFSYFNNQEQLVGYDVSAAYRLARNLQVGIEFVPVDWDTLEQDLIDQRFDIVMAGAYATPERLARLSVSNFYLVSPVALIVKSSDVADYATYAAVRAMPNLKLAIFHDPQMSRIAQTLFPDAEIIQLDSYEELPKHPEVNAALWTLDQAAAWASAHDNYTALSPAGIGAPLAVAYLLPPLSTNFLRYLNLLLDLEKTDGVRERESSYWIKGEPRPDPRPRWNLLDVLLGRD